MTIEYQYNPLLVELNLPLSEDTLADELPNLKYLPVWNFLADFKPKSGGDNLEKIKGCLQAFYHLYDLEDLDRCERLLLHVIDSAMSYQLIIPQTDRPLHIQIQDWGNLEIAIDLYQKILEREVINHRHTWLRSLGHCYRDRAEYQKAQQYFDLSLEMAESNHNLEETVISYIDLVTIYGSRGDFDRAIEIGQRGLEIAQQIDAPIDVLRPLQQNLAIAHGYRYDRNRQAEDLNMATEYFNLALIAAENSQNRDAQKSMVGNFVNLYIVSGDLDRAIECVLQSIDLFQDIDRPNQQAFNFGNLGVIYCMQGQQLQQNQDFVSAREKIDLGIEYLLKSLQISEDLEDRSNQVWIHCNLAEAYLITNRIATGLQHLESAENTLLEINPSEARLEDKLRSIKEQFIIRSSMVDR